MARRHCATLRAHHGWHRPWMDLTMTIVLEQLVNDTSIGTIRPRAGA
jgi:hypothetical protein